MLCCQACNSGFDYISSTIRFDNCIVAVNYVTLPKGYVAGFPLPVQTDMMVIQRTAPQLACQAYSRPPSAELSSTFGPSVQANRVSKPPTKPKVALERCHPNEGLSTERLIPSAKRGRSNKQLLVKNARVPLPTTPIRFPGLGHGRCCPTVLGGIQDRQCFGKLAVASAGSSRSSSRTSGCCHHAP
jgi:hypothetical protein